MQRSQRGASLFSVDGHQTLVPSAVPARARNANNLGVEDGEDDEDADDYTTDDDVTTQTHPVDPG